MKPWAIVAIVFGVLLVLAGSGVGIYFAVRSKPESSETKPESSETKPESSETKLEPISYADKFKQGDELSIGRRRCYITTGGIEGENISLAEAQQQCWEKKFNNRLCVGIRKSTDAASGWIPCLEVWKNNLSLDPETYIIEERLPKE
jgi:hypothetical protein